MGGQPSGRGSMGGQPSGRGSVSSAAASVAAGVARPSQEVDPFAPEKRKQLQAARLAKEQVTRTLTRTLTEPLTLTLTPTPTPTPTPTLTLAQP